MTATLLLVFEQKSGEVLECVEFDREGYENREALYAAIEKETFRLNEAHSLPHDLLGLQQCGGKTVTSYFEWSPDKKLTDRTIHVKVAVE